MLQDLPSHLVQIYSTNFFLYCNTSTYLCVLFLQIRPTVCSRTATKSPITTLNELKSHEKSSYMRNSCFASPQNSFYRKFNRLFSSASLSCESATSSAERTALLGAASQRSLLLSSDLRDEDTLL